MSNLAQSGVISPKTLIESTDIPYKNKLLKDVEARDQLMAQAQALAQENEQLKAALSQVDESLQKMEPRGMQAVWQCVI